jgi:hypothetical protein
MKYAIYFLFIIEKAWGSHVWKKFENSCRGLHTKRKLPHVKIGKMLFYKNWQQTCFPESVSEGSCLYCGLLIQPSTSIRFLFTSLMPTLVSHGLGSAVLVCRCCKTSAFVSPMRGRIQETIVFVSPMRGLIQKQQLLQRFWAHTIPKPLFL